MTYIALETSIESGRPVELYHFSIGTTHYYYTSAPDSFLFGGNTWLPRNITRSSPVQSTEERKQQLEITMPAEDPVASRFINIIPGFPMALEVTRYHRGDTEALIVWSGNIVGSTYKKQGGECTLRGVTTEAAFSRAIPRFKYQGMCNHILFDSNCTALASDYEYDQVCSAAATTTITIPGIFAAKGTNWAVGGYANLNDSDYRLIISQVGDTLTMYIAFESDPVGQTVKVFAGCGHTLTDCANKFTVVDPTNGNVINYGGFPFVPELNPFVVGMD